MMTEKQLQEIDEHYLKFRIFGYTLRWFSTSPLHIYNHVQRVKNRSMSAIAKPERKFYCWDKEALNTEKCKSVCDFCQCPRVDPN